MKPSFNKLSEDKKESILIAAIEEFFTYEYNDASTNRIVEKAGISKGSLYYYFESKANLYLNCQIYTFEIFKVYLSTYSQSEEGFIERLIRVNSFKQDFMNQHLAIFNFFALQFYKELFPENIMQEIIQFDEGFKKVIYDDIDYDLFRDDINVNHAMQLIKWTIQGYERDVALQTKNNRFNFDNIDQCFKDSESYFETLKRVYYK